MKKDNGITMVSLVIYIMVMIIVTTMMTAIIDNFYENTYLAKENLEEIVKFNKFNNYFLKEIKTKNNKVDSISNDYILFTSGNSFSISDNIIYYNNIEICNNVKSLLIIPELEKDIIKITIDFENFNKTINYKIEEIY